LPEMAGKGVDTSTRSSSTACLPFVGTSSVVSTSDASEEARHLLITALFWF